MFSEVEEGNAELEHVELKKKQETVSKKRKVSNPYKFIMHHKHFLAHDLTERSSEKSISMWVVFSMRQTM